MKLLLFVEPTERGEWAMQLADELARGLGGPIVLLTTEENLAKEPRLLLHAAEKFAQIPGLAILKKSRPGSVREAVIQETRDTHPAITIVPPAGRNKLARIFKGSRVQAVVHSAPSTVMVARKPVSEHIRSLLVSVSGGPMSETTAVAAQEIAQALHARITLLHVSTAVPIPYAATGSVEDATTDVLTAHAARARSVKCLCDLLAQHGSAPRVQMREGRVVTEIVRECGTGDYDLLILGQHVNDRYAGEAFPENIAEELALECPIPVLVVRTRRWAEGAAAKKADSGAPAAPLS